MKQSNNLKRIGIMGGTFNPIHNGHLRMAQAAYEQYKLDEIVFMPSGNPPHKKKKNIVSDAHRSRMIRLALSGVSHFSFSDRELKRDGTTYTIDTLREMRREHPDWQIFFILGEDSLAGFDSWHQPDAISEQCTILAVPRGAKDVSFEKMCDDKSRLYRGDFLPVKMEHLEISSESIRKTLKKGNSAIGLCPQKVLTYIRLHGLYGTEPKQIRAEKKRSQLLRCLCSTLAPGRYRHTLGVAQTAATLGFCHLGSKQDVSRAELAGLLHDCAKYYTGEEMVTLCDEHHILLSDIERKNTGLIHGKLGAYLARERYGIKDEEILSSIQYHTTGRPDMTVLEKIIYVADYIEPGRDMDCHPYSLEKVRKMCYQDLDRGLLMILCNTIEYLRSSERETDPVSLMTYEYYKERTDLK